MDYKNPLIIFVLLLMPIFAQGQSQSYDMAFVPDLWYNEVDGIRLGLRFSGNMEGTYQDGPHRLDAGIWVGSKLPDEPVSYYFSLTEPINSLSSFGSEANVQLRSSIRTGYSLHTFSMSKRWQPGFDELTYKELSVSFSREKLYNSNYRPYPQLWQTNWKSILGLNSTLSAENSLGRLIINGSISQNLQSGESFTVGDLIVKQFIPLSNGFKIMLRGFGGFASDNTAPEYLYGASYRQPRAWLSNGVMRAKGTMPQSWLNDGLFQVAGSANMRGYTQQDFEALANGNSIQYDQVLALNTEIIFPNPLDNMLNRSLLGDFVSLQSYVFGDAGKFSGRRFDNTLALYEETSGFKADAGLGLQFSLNIPDYLGKDRGFALRYEIPLWLSDPARSEGSFKFRHVIGIGAVISL